MIEIKAADLEVRCFFYVEDERAYTFLRIGGNGDWGLDGCPLSAFGCRLSAVGFRLTAARGMVFPKEALDFRLSDFRLWTA